MTTRALPHGESAPQWSEARPETPVAARRLSLLDAAVLGLIALLVVLVSLPRLRRFVLRENETDAIRALREFSDEVGSHGSVAWTGTLAGLLAHRPERRPHLEDLEVLPDGRLRRHGYLFTTAATASGRTVFLAWPWEHGRTGLGAFAIEPGGDALGCANADGRFSGPARPPGPPGLAADRRGDATAWVPIPRSIGRR